MPRHSPSRKGRAPQVLGNQPTIRDLRFAPLPLATHPIDLYDGPQGWGPFYGPWTPWDFRDPASSISDHYGMGESNDWQFAPPYDIITVFHDPSLDWVYNTSYDVSAEHAQAADEIQYSSTISNQVPAHTGGFLQRLASVLRGE